MKTKIKIGSKSFFIPYILPVLLAAVVLRFVLSPYGTLELDQNTFIGWSRRLIDVGFGRFYDTWSDYLPGYLYVLWFLGWLQKILPISPVFLFKLPAILSDVATGLLIYLIVKKIKNEKLGLMVASIYLFNPAILANSTLWGQVDSLTALFSLLAIWLVDISPPTSSLALAFGILVKPQTALALPVVLFILVKKKVKTQRILAYGFISLSFFILSFVPFSVGKSLIPFIFERVGATLNQYPFASVNAFNFWGLFGFWVKETLVLQFFGLLITFLFLIFALAKVGKLKDRYLLSAFVFLAGFLFFTRMHERHLLPALAPLAVAASSFPFLWIAYFGLSMTYVANLYYSYHWIVNEFALVFPTFAIKLMIVLNLFFFSLLIVEIYKKGKGWALPKTDGLKKITFKKRKMVLLAILVFSFISRVFLLSNPQHEYFDEVYHAFTARRMLHGDPKAWEWWNTPPEGFAYEWTHPPLAKLGMVLGMSIFGENSLGWRVPGAILGTLSVLLIYLLARVIFKDEVISLLSAAIFSLDGLPLVMSRIGMNDAYFLFFILLSLLLFIKNKNFWSAVALGLAASSKWSTAWALPIFALSYFSLKKKFSPSYFWFLLIPPTIYLASYFPMFLTGHGLDTFIGVQKQMWWYHSNLEAEHAYTSAWWSWPILVRPIWLYTSGQVTGKIANIYAMGNPVIFWFGLAAVGLALISGITKRDKNLGLTLFSYFVFFVPWAVSPRIMFFYHYLPSLPFLAIILATQIRKFPKLIIPFFLLALVTFIYFYPHLTGISVFTKLDESFYWFPSWR